MKFLSRKLFAFLFTAAVDYFVAQGQLPAEIKPLFIQLLTLLGGLYICVQTILDFVKERLNG